MATYENDTHATEFVDTPTLGVGTLLELFDGDLAGVGELLEAALRSINADLVRIATAIESTDRAQVIEAAHRLKGTSGSIRSGRLIAAGAAIELHAKTTSEPVPDALSGELTAAVAEVNADFERHRRRVAALTAL